MKILNKIGSFITNTVSSLDNIQGAGYSARKLTALFAILMAAYITKYRVPAADYLHALYAWQILALLCLGIITVEQIINFKNGNTPNEPKPE